MKKVPCREKRPTLQFCPLETEFKLRNRQKFCNVWWIILLGIWSCDGETASCAFWVSQLRAGPERVALEVLGRRTGDFPGEGCDGETASCAFWVSQLRTGPERVSLEVLGRGTGDFPGECCDGETASCAFWVSHLWGQKHTPFFSGLIPQQSGWISVGNMRECVKLPRLFGN